MFSQFDNEEVETYFNHLNAQLKKLPSEDRAEMHQEIRQHLEALAAAHEELGATPREAAEAALRQFGDPKRIGQKMFREWHISRYGSRKTKVAAVSLCVSQLLAFDLMWHILPATLFLHVPDWAGLAICLSQFVIVGGTVGLCFPRHGLAASIHSMLFSSGWWVSHEIFRVMALRHNPAVVLSVLLPDDIRLSALDGSLVLLLVSLSAYAASALRRGSFYRVQIADLKLWSRR